MDIDIPFDFDECVCLNSSRSWLKSFSSSQAETIAYRTAMRTFPLWCFLTRHGDPQSFPTLPIVRLAFCDSVDEHFRVKSHARRLAHKCFLKHVYDANEIAMDLEIRPYFPPASVGGQSATAAINASYSAVQSRVQGALPEFHAQIRDDALKILRGGDVREAKLWAVDNALVDFWGKAMPRLASLPGGQFWIDWYQGILDGRPQNWAMLRDVATIDDDLWQKGDADLDRAINAIRQDHALNATRNGEDVQLNAETGKLRLVPASDLPEDRAIYVRRKILRAVAIFDDPRGQAYGALAADLNMLRRAVADAGDLPVELYDACASALRRLEVRCRNGECPSAEQDALINDYRQGLRDAGLDILGADATAQQVIQSRAAVAGNDALVDARDAVLEFADHASALSEGWLAEALPADARLATDPAVAPQQRADAAYRFVGRSLRFLREVRAGFGTGMDAVCRPVSFVQALEWLAAQRLLQTLFQYLGL